MFPSLQNAVQSLQSKLGIGSSYPVVSIQSSVDGQTYRVRDMSDKQAAADLLARVRIKMKKLYMHLETSYPDKIQVIQLMRNFKPDAERLLESTPDEEHTSFSVNKGQSVHLCLRQRSGGNENLVEENVMMFVTLHEMAHMITKSVGHEPEFWNNFGWILKEAEKINVYHYQDFKSHPVAYCGVQITDQPRYDPQKDGADHSVGKMFSFQ
jgi:hypothetical protein